MRNWGHANPVGFDEDSRPVLVEMGNPFDTPEFANDEQREGAAKAIDWVLEAIGREAIVTKLIALRFAAGKESRTMQQLAAEYGVSRQAISALRVGYAERFRLILGKSNEARGHFADAQKRAWQTRRATNGSKP